MGTHLSSASVAEEGETVGNAALLLGCGSPPPLGLVVGEELLTVLIDGDGSLWTELLGDIEGVKPSAFELEVGAVGAIGACVLGAFAGADVDSLHLVNAPQDQAKQAARAPEQK